MPGFAAGLAGLGGVSEGYLDTEDKRATTQFNQAQTAQAQTDLAAGQLAGAALQLLGNSGSPPSAPMPGQPSAPAAPSPSPQPPPQPQGGMQAPSMQGSMIPGPGNQQIMGLGGPQMRPGAPPGGPPPGMSPPGNNASQPGPPQPGGRPGGGPPQGTPSLDLQSIIQAVVRASGGKQVPPQVIMAAVNKFVPLMNAQAQMQWREMSLALREQTIAQREQQMGGVQSRFDTRENRLDRAQAFKELQAKVTNDFKLKQLQQRYQEAANRKSTADQRTVLIAMHDRAEEVIQASGLDDPTVTKLLEQNDKFYEDQIKQITSGGAARPGNGAGKPSTGPKWNAQTGRIED